MTTIAITLVGRVITFERTIKKISNELLPKIKQRRLRAITLQWAIEKSHIFFKKGMVRKHHNYLAFLKSPIIFYLTLDSKDSCRHFPLPLKAFD